MASKKSWKLAGFKKAGLVETPHHKDSGKPIKAKAKAIAASATEKQNAKIAIAFGLCFANWPEPDGSINPLRSIEGNTQSPIPNQALTAYTNTAAPAAFVAFPTLDLAWTDVSTADIAQCHIVRDYYTLVKGNIS